MLSSAVTDVLMTLYSVLKLGSCKIGLHEQHSRQIHVLSDAQTSVRMRALIRRTAIRTQRSSPGCCSPLVTVAALACTTPLPCRRLPAFAMPSLPVSKACQRCDQLLAERIRNWLALRFCLVKSLPESGASRWLNLHLHLHLPFCRSTPGFLDGKSLQWVTQLRWASDLALPGEVDILHGDDTQLFH